MATLDPTEPVSLLRSIPIQENHEPLVDFLEECPDLRLDRPRFKYRRETVIRRSVAERLCAANELLMAKGYRLLVVEGWRPPFIQRRMFRFVEKQFQERYPDLSPEALRELVETFSAPMDEHVPPPHTTGGAVDLWLGDLDGKPVNLTEPYEFQDERAFAFSAPDLTEEARRNRDLLAQALLHVGLTNYPSEYWHWSYGDQGWAYRGGHPHALYGATEPPQWKPAVEDDVEGPLEFVAV